MLQQPGRSGSVVALAVLMVVVVLVAAGCRSTADPSSASTTLSGLSTVAATRMPDEVACPRPEQVAGEWPSSGTVPAVDGILAAFARTPVVAIGERHGWVRLHELLAQLVCDPRFATTVDAVVVEFGNSRLQPVLDRYMAGDAVPADELATVWRATTQRSGVWDHPVYRRLLGLLRTVNRGRPPAERVRVLAGDPPVDMALVTDTADCSERDPACLDHWLQQRDTTFAAIVDREVVTPGRTALLIAGVGHVMRRSDPGRPPSVSDLLELGHPGITTVVIPHLGFTGDAAEVAAAEALLAGWPAPSLAWLRGSALGDQPAHLVTGEPVAAATIAEVADAYLYLGDP